MGYFVGIHAFMHFPLTHTEHCYTARGVLYKIIGGYPKVWLLSAHGY